MATDLAEVIGGAIALHLLFGPAAVTGGVITGAVAFLLLALQTRGDRRFDRTPVTVFFGVILVAFLLLCCACRSTRPRRRAAWCPASTASRASCWPPASSAPP